MKIVEVDMIGKFKIKYFILVCAVSFISIGVYSNEYKTVLGKAIKICLECIGIG